MFGRKWFAILLFGALGVPYLLSSSRLAGLVSRFRPRASGGEPAAAVMPGEQRFLGPGTHASKPPLEGAAVEHLGEVIRFDVTTAWVLGRWSRVSTGLAELDLEGYRVPLVTGNRPADLAGSLTYYFNPQQRVQRITFYGTTGDARRLVALLTLRHGFVRQITDDPGLFLYLAKNRGKATGELRIRASRVVRADAPHARFEVALVMERPTGEGRAYSPGGSYSKPFHFMGRRNGSMRSATSPF